MLLAGARHHATWTLLPLLLQKGLLEGKMAALQILFKIIFNNFLYAHPLHKLQVASCNTVVATATATAYGYRNPFPSFLPVKIPHQNQYQNQKPNQHPIPNRCKLQAANKQNLCCTCRGRLRIAVAIP